MLNKLIILACLITSLNLFSQDKLKFQSKSEYLNFLEKKYNIQKSNVYYFKDYDYYAFVDNVSLCVFVKGNKMITAQDMAKKEGNIHRPKKYFSLLTRERVNSALVENTELYPDILKNIETDIGYDFSKQLTALFLYSHQMGSMGLKFYNYRDNLEKLNIKCILVSLDEAEIKGISNANSIQVKKQ